MRLEVRAADKDGPAQRYLGSARSNGCILLPSSLITFLDEFGLLDAAAHGSAPQASPVVPCQGRYLLVVGSDRDDAGVEPGAGIGWDSRRRGAP